MQRRELIGLIGSAALAVTRPAIGQTKANLPLVGVLLPFRQDTKIARVRIAAIRKGLQESGFIEGTNYSLALRFADGDWERLPALGKELGALNPKVIVASSSTYGISAIHRSFPTLPLVFTAIAADPIKLGLADSYARPGGMFTGNVMNAVGGEETVTQKRIGFFKELVPGLTRLGVIGTTGAVAALGELDALRKVSGQFGLESVFYPIQKLDDLEGAFASGLRDDVSALYISGDPLLFANMSQVMTFVVASGKPSVGPYPDWGRSGLLMSYSTDGVDGFRHAGSYAARILNGAKPGDLPIEQASKFILVINLKTAKALGITVPPTLLALADEVIE